MGADLFGGLMGKQKRPHFASEFRLEAAQLVVDQGYSVEKAREKDILIKATALLMSGEMKNLRCSSALGALPVPGHTALPGL